MLSQYKGDVKVGYNCKTKSGRIKKRRMLQVIDSINQDSDYWNTFSINKNDIEFINNYLFENETPRTAHELTPVLFDARIQLEKQRELELQEKRGKAYIPMENYEIGENLVFPQFDWAEGKVIGIRPGINPDIEAFSVMEVEFQNKQIRQLAIGLADHKLNNASELDEENEDLKKEQVFTKVGGDIESKLESALIKDKGLVRIAGRWFPKSLLIDINVGHLNLAEAVLDEADGGPLNTSAIMQQMEMPAGINNNLLEFSMNFALQEDPRFDEVGPAGQVLWCLERLEPDSVRKIPVELKYDLSFDVSDELSEEMKSLEYELDDELSQIRPVEKTQDEEVIICLTYPHWRAGTLPVSARVHPFIPYAYESERVRFSLLDSKSKEEVPAWVVRKNHYVYGLKDLYDQYELFPGSLIRLRKSKKPGFIIFDPMTHRPKKEWIRTVLVGRDGGIVFATLKQNVASEFNERMIVAVPDVAGVDKAREQFSKNKKSLRDNVFTIMKDLSKLNLQGHVHAQELYSAFNIVMRCPPAPLFTQLISDSRYTHVGDLHFRIEETGKSS
jgi:hypothetical protein